ncbi:MAG: hypothetical protein V8T45_09620 [Oscillospiraceae bacterium]
MEKQYFQGKIGIHCHNDTGCAVAATIAAVRAGACHVQGAYTGVGERCGNTNLAAAIANLQLKFGYVCVPEDCISRMTGTARYDIGGCQMYAVCRIRCHMSEKARLRTKADARRRGEERTPPRSSTSIRRIWSATGGRFFLSEGVRALGDDEQNRRSSFQDSAQTIGRNWKSWLTSSRSLSTRAISLKRQPQVLKWWCSRSWDVLSRSLRAGTVPDYWRTGQRQTGIWLQRW